MTPECVAPKPLKFADASPCNGDNFILKTVYNTLAIIIALQCNLHRQQAGIHLGLVQSPKLSNRLNQSSLDIKCVMSHLTRVTTCKSIVTQINKLLLLRCPQQTCRVSQSVDQTCPQSVLQLYFAVIHP